MTLIRRADRRRMLGYTMAIRALLFDAGNTLWQYTLPATADRVDAIAARQIGALLTQWREARVDPLALARAVSAAVRAAERTAKRSLISANYDEAVDEAARGCGLDLDGERLDALWAAWYVDPERLGRQVFPDAASTLRWAHDAGYRLALVGNGRFGVRYMEAELHGYGLHGLFDTLALSCERGWLKPHPRIFLDALCALGVEPDEALMVGDSLVDDVKGAMLLGMRAVWKRNGRRPPPGEHAAIVPTYQIDDLWELRTLPALRRAGDGTPLPPGALIPSEDHDIAAQPQRPDRYA